ncbi:MAG TPA: NAD(P)H-dependent oxidoreductase [Holophagaceae bacterium]|nr:NAD(P)H-dependent oxidoreductase [Holophagaceae bacterium]
MDPRRFLFLLSSARHDGNSEALARAAARRLPEGAESRWIHLDLHPLPPFEDTRHSSGFAEPEGDARMLAEATLWATDLVFVLPVYWYSLPSPLKLYLDHWSAWMRLPSLKLKESLAGRNLWAVVVDSDTGNEGSAEPVLDSLRRTADYMGMRWRGALQGHANKPGEILGDAGAMAAAARYFGQG